jgi:hypothetical protein
LRSRSQIRSVCGVVKKQETTVKQVKTTVKQVKTTVKLRARWTGGVEPHVGDYLASTVRPRYAYYICEVTRVDKIVGWDPALKTEFQRLEIAAKRVPLDSVPEDARVHPWRWDKREARKPK